MQTVTPSKQLSLMIALKQEDRLASDVSKAVFLYNTTNQIGASRHGGTPCFCLLTKGFDDKMFSDRRVTAYRAFARDNPCERIICLRLLYHIKLF